MILRWNVGGECDKLVPSLSVSVLLSENIANIFIWIFVQGIGLGHDLVLLLVRLFMFILCCRTTHREYAHFQRHTLLDDRIGVDLFLDA